LSRRPRLATLAVLAGLCLTPSPFASSAQAQQQTAGPAAKVGAAFTPDRLGAASSISIAMAIDAPAEAQPPPLSTIAVSFPTDLGLATSGLGLASCSPITLEDIGPKGCPPNSKMGSGSAAVEVAFGPTIVPENVTLDLYAAPSNDGYIHLGILATGHAPVGASVVLNAVLLPGSLQITVPAIVSLPGAPLVSLLAMRANLGGALTYYQREHPLSVAYRPQGIGLPDRCPLGGWKLGATFTFVEGQSSSAQTAVPCPGGRLHRG
jgi:hypothetical protein